MGAWLKTLCHKVVKFGCILTTEVCYLKVDSMVTVWEEINLPTSQQEVVFEHVTSYLSVNMEEFEIALIVLLCCILIALLFICLSIVFVFKKWTAFFIRWSVDLEWKFLLGDIFSVTMWKSICIFIVIQNLILSCYNINIHLCCQENMYIAYSFNRTPL